MNQTVPTSILIGAQILAKHAHGDTVEDRFRSLLKPSVLSEGAFMCGSEDEQFRAAVGGLILSYPEGSDERQRIEAEMRGLNQISVMLQAAQLGMSAVPDFDTIENPIGLMALWRERDKR